MTLGEVLLLIWMSGWLLLAIISSIGFYFLPTILALILNNVNTVGIFIVNLLTGWTGLGWLASLIWAVIK